MNYTPQAAELAEAKWEHPWLRDAPSHVVQQTLRDLDQACRTHGTFRVRWRSKRGWSPSFRSSLRTARPPRMRLPRLAKLVSIGVWPLLSLLAMGSS